ncbi:unnamed protein product [Malus baccata var. baccata]
MTTSPKKERSSATKTRRRRSLRRELKKPRTHIRALREEEEAGLSKSHGLGSASLRTFKEASSPHESPLVLLNLVPSPIKHGTVVQSSPVPYKEVKQTPPKYKERKVDDVL